MLQIYISLLLGIVELDIWTCMKLYIVRTESSQEDMLRQEIDISNSMEVPMENTLMPKSVSYL